MYITWLARPSCYVMTYPDYHQSLVMIDCLIVKYHHLVMLSFKTKHDTLDFVIIMFTGILSCYYGTKCHTTRWGPPLESIPQNKVPHGTKCHTTRRGSPLESVGATSWICRAIPVMFTYSSKLIILNKLQLVWGMGGSDGCRNDTLLIVMD